VAAAAMAKLARLGMTISQFQAANGLKVDRIVGPKTLRALGVDVDRARLLCA
jgi:murein L,D-transpeptidase YcbB/YkuD